MKAFFPVALVLLLAVACATSGTGETNAGVAVKLFDAFNRHDWQGMASFYSDTASFLDPSYGKEFVTQTRDQIVQKYNEMESMFPDIHDEVVGIYPSGDIVTVEFISTGTMNDSISFTLPIISVLTFRDGLIIKDATYYDMENP